MDEEITIKKYRIPMIRQWLNEHRIDDVKKFVNNKDIEHWLGLHTHNNE